MARRRKRTISIHLTERALHDIVEIETYSVRKFGRKVTNQYLKKLEAAIDRVGENPELLSTLPEFHSRLQFYRCEKHLLVCDNNESDRIIVLTVIHASMDTPSRLPELEPNLAVETEILHRILDEKEGDV